MTRKRKIVSTITFTIAVLLIVNIGASFYFYHLAIQRGPKDFLQGNEDLEVSAEAMDEFLDGDWIDWTHAQPFEELELTSFDGLSLKGYYLEAPEPTPKTVVFAHGYLGHAYDMGLFGQFYAEQLGYNVFTPDLRGHGKSEGNYYGFGWHDRLDLVDWIALLIERYGEDTEIVLHGLSMGAAAVVMASGETLPDNVKAIVADSPYTSVYDLFQYQMERMFHLPDKPILPTTSLVTKMKANYTFQEASALEQVKKNTLPILYFTGEADTFVPTEMTHELYDATTSEREIVTFPHANHGEGIVLYRERYIETVSHFLQQHMDNI